MSDQFYHETQKYRCLVEVKPFPSDALRLTMCGVESCIPGKGYGPVIRDGYHLHIILSGKGYLEIGSEKTLLNGGQMFVEKPHETTHYYADETDPWTYCWMTYEGTQAEEMTHLAGFPSGINWKKCTADPKEFFMLADQALSNQQLSVGASLHRHGLLSQFLALAIESNQKITGIQASYIHQKRTYIDYAVDFIRRNYAAITVHDISDYLGINRSYLCRLFREFLQCTPQEYLNSTRMHRSAELLAGTTLPIREIAAIVGYEDQLTFSKAFKKAYQVSPKNYREMAAEDRYIPDSVPQKYITNEEDNP